MNEIWKDIPIANGYEASNLGKIRNKKTKHIIKQVLNDRGYNQVGLYINGKKSYKVHRLVANAFLDNSNNYKTVNHIDGNKQNNCVENLEWCTYKHNMQEAYRLGLIKGGLKDKFGKDYPKKINIIGMYKDGILLEKFYGTGEIKRKYNYVPVAILDCCKGKYKKMYGYEWRFINEQV